MKVLCNLGKAKANQRLNWYDDNFVGYSYIYIYVYMIKIYIYIITYDYNIYIYINNYK